MTSPPDDTTTGTSAIIAALRTERDAALAREAALAEELAARTAELATRNTEYGERIEQQTATIDVLKVMSASPGDAQPVFDLIVRHATELCDVPAATLNEYDGELVHMRSSYRSETIMASSALAAYMQLFPMRPTRGSITCRAILDRQIVHIRDLEADPELAGFVRELGHRSQVSVPLIRNGLAIGVISITAREPGGFSDSQIELLKTFAEQAVIAITSAETYRALQTRTSDLQETLEYQTATSDVLKVISSSNFALEPVFQTVVETAARLCRADHAVIFRLQDDAFRWAAGTDMLPEFERRMRTSVVRPGTGSLIGRVALQGRPVQILDRWTDPLSTPGAKDSARIGGVRSALGVPLVRDGVTIGAMGLNRLRVEPFTDRQIELVSTFADQAVIAIENTRLITEQREALEQQTATAEVLQVINASPGDLAPVFDAILEKAHHLCGAVHGVLGTYNGDYFRAVASRGLPAAVLERLKHGFHGLENPITRPLFDGARFVQIPDLKEVDHPMPKAVSALGGFRTALFVPLRKDGTLLGHITALRSEVRPFTDKQIALLQNFAAQAVIAMENARLITETREALERQTATAEVLQVINASPGDLGPVFDAILEKAHSLCGAAVGSLMFYDGTVLRAVATRGYPEQYSALVREPFPPGTTHQALLRGDRLFHVPDMQAVAPAPGVEARLRLFTELGLRTGLFVPLRTDGVLLGIISAARLEVRPFSDKEIALLENFASQAVIAMENARLLTEQQEALEQQTATAEVLQVINANPGNLAPVFEAMLQRATHLCGTAIGTFWSYNGGAFEVLASTIGDIGRTTQPGPDTVLWRIAHGESVVQIADVEIEPAYRVDAVGQMRTRLAGTRTALAVALRKDETLVGAITTGRPEVRPFTDKQIALLQNFAAQAVIAMENARLITEQREALEQQTATAEVLQVINANPGNLTPVFDAILDKAHTLCGAAIGSLVLFDGTYFRAVATHGWPNSIAALFSEPAGPNRARQRLVDGERFVQVADIRAIGRGPNSAWGDAVVESTDARTMLLVPLRKDGALLGLISAFRPEVRVFSDKEITLLENFAAQAVIAMENARLLTEQREALEQQTATAQVLQIINSSPGNLTPVFDAMLEKAMRLCEAPFGSLYTYDGESFRSAAQRGVPLAYAEFRARNPPTLVPGSGMETLVTTKRTFHVLDVKARDHYRTGEPGARAMVDLGGIRTLLSVRLVKDDALVGIFSIYRQEVRAFSDRQIELLENFAAQAVIAMENARLLIEQQEALDQQTATAEVLQVINASPGNLAPVFDAMLEKAIRLCQAEFGTLRTWDGERFHLGAAHGDPRLIEWTRRHGPFTPDGDAPLARIVRGEEVVRITDDQLAAYQTSSGFGAMAAAIGFRSGITLALRKDATLLGTITVYRKNEDRPFTDKQVALLQNFAAQAVIAMENARLLDEIRQRQAELRVTFDNMGDGVVMFDAEHRLAAWNRNFQQLLDVPDAMLAERPSYADYLSLLAEQGEFGTDDVEAELARRLGDTDRELRLERTRPDGRVIEVRRNAVPGGGFVLIYSDITERKRSEEEIRAARDAAEAALRELRTAQANLIQAEKMASLGQLTAGIAHEIKNPLNFVNNFAALSVDLLGELKETAAPGFAVLPEKQRAEIDEVSAMLTSNLEKINEHGRRADGIVKAMLEHSRGSSGERHMVDLNALIDEALNLAYHGARAQDQSFNITLERDFGEGIAPIEVNPQDITRVFLNLFANGFYATTKRAREGGDAGFVPALKVTTRDAGDGVEIRVRDNGTGIPADIRNKLFQPFFTTKPTGEGTGLGLSITYDIVTQQHGGSIAVESNVGEYSEFTILLPREP